MHPCCSVVGSWRPLLLNTCPSPGQSLQPLSSTLVGACLGLDAPSSTLSFQHQSVFSFVVSRDRTKKRGEGGGRRISRTKKTNVLQQLIQGHFVREVTDSLGISISTATKIRKVPPGDHSSSSKERSA